MVDTQKFRELQRRRWDDEYSADDPLWRGPPEAEILLPRDATVLELGCGNGKTLVGLIGRGCFVVAIDYSSRAIRICQKRLGTAPDLQLLVSDSCSLPFSDGSFDIITAFHILEHLLEEDRIRVVLECRRVIRPGGKIFVFAFSTRDMRCGKGVEVERNTFLRGNSIAYHCFSREEIRALLTGFKEESLEERITDKHYDGESLQRVTLNGVFSRL
jgi:ubiquinone/menaquinone biosynthesis C-methylase UbiE